MEDHNKKDGKIDIELTAELAEGLYSNLAVINHSNSEFIVDFINIMPGIPKPKVKSRIILTPQHAKRLAHALLQNIQKFEKQFGEIKEFEQPEIPISFGGPVGEA